MLQENAWESDYLQPNLDQRHFLPDELIVKQLLADVSLQTLQGFYLLGGHAIYLDPKSIELGKREVRHSYTLCLPNPFVQPCNDSDCAHGPLFGGRALRRSAGALLLEQQIDLHLSHFAALGGHQWKLQQPSPAEFIRNLGCQDRWKVLLRHVFRVYDQCIGSDAASMQWLITTWRSCF